MRLMRCFKLSYFNARVKILGQNFWRTKASFSRSQSCLWSNLNNTANNAKRNNSIFFTGLSVVPLSSSALKNIHNWRSLSFITQTTINTLENSLKLLWVTAQKNVTNLKHTKAGHLIQLSFRNCNKISAFENTIYENITRIEFFLIAKRNNFKQNKHFMLLNNHCAQQCKTKRTNIVIRNNLLVYEWINLKSKTWYLLFVFVSVAPSH